MHSHIGNFLLCMSVHLPDYTSPHETCVRPKGAWYRSREASSRPWVGMSQIMGGPGQALGCPSQVLGGSSQALGCLSQALGGPNHALEGLSWALGGKSQSLLSPSQELRGPRQALRSPSQALGGLSDWGPGKPVLVLQHLIQAQGDLIQALESPEPQPGGATLRDTKAHAQIPSQLLGGPSQALGGPSWDFGGSSQVLRGPIQILGCPS